MPEIDSYSRGERHSSHHVGELALPLDRQQGDHLLLGHRRPGGACPMTPLTGRRSRHRGSSGRKR